MSRSDAVTRQFPTTPLASTLLPSTPLVRAAYAYVYQYTTPAVAHHTIRSAFFSLILRNKIPSFSTQINAETLVIATLLHDLGWSRTPELVSEDKRFEIDGANAAREFVRSRLGTEGVEGWTEERLQSLWYAIALHTTRSIAFHSEPLVANTSMGISADFLGPNLPSQVPGVAQLITPEDFTEIIRKYPRLGFKEELRGIMCGLCRSKPETTFDNFVADYGRRFVEGYDEKLEAASGVTRLEGGLDGTVQYE